LDCHYSTLPAEALLHITGPETLQFLQGQTTCDTRLAGPRRSALGAYCTPQGRVVCDFLLAALGDEHFALRMRRDLREQAAAVFGKYIVFSRATLEATRDDWEVAAIWGRDAAQALRGVFGELPDGPLHSVSGAGFTLVQTDPAGTAFECYLGPGSNWHAVLSTALPPGDDAAWQALQIRAGMARIEGVTSGKYVAQVLNYDLTGHVSFTKGCYTGQEVIARLHYRGTAKRRSFVATLPGAARVGDPVFDCHAGQSAGEVINCAAGGEGTHLALVAATCEAAARGLCLQPGGKAPLQLGSLPYELPV